MEIPTQEEIIRTLDANPLFRRLSATADRLQLETYVVGGYVRDLLLHRPTNDVDVVVVGSGVTMAEAFARSLGRGAHLSVFRNFGTAQVKWHGREVEFVGARRESYSHDSRKPIVEDGTLQDDQERRDFTVNALAICLNAARYGELIDPFDGLADLEDGLLCTPLDPDVTFSDDPLRMMRCVRFAAQLHFTIEEETFEAIRRNRERLKIVSAERIIVELNKIMMADHPSIGLEAMQHTGLMELVLPEVAALDVVETRQGKRHKNNFDHSLAVLENIVARQRAATPPPGGPKGKADGGLWLRWAALLHDIGKTAAKRWEAGGWTFHNHDYIGFRMVKPLFRRLKLPLDERMKYVEKLVSLHMRPIAIADAAVTDSAVRRLLFEAGDDIEDLMTLCEADITSRNEARKQGFLRNFQLVREKLKALEAKDRDRLFQPPVRGDEIMRLFNLPPCREVGDIKGKLKQAVVKGDIPNEREAALAFVVRYAATLGLTPVEPPATAPNPADTATDAPADTAPAAS